MKSQIDKVKIHVKRNQTYYICLGYTVFVAAFTGLIMKELRTTLDAGVDDPVREFTDSFSFLSGRSIFGDVNNNAVTTIHKVSRGNPGFVTRCVETGELFATQGDAAKAFNIPESILSKHLNFGRILQEGLTFERVGVLASI